MDYAFVLVVQHTLLLLHAQYSYWITIHRWITDYIIYFDMATTIKALPTSANIHTFGPMQAHNDWYVHPTLHNHQQLDVHMHCRQLLYYSLSNWSFWATCWYMAKKHAAGMKINVVLTYYTHMCAHHNRSPYTNNGGTVVAIAGADYCIVAAGMYHT